MVQISVSRSVVVKNVSLRSISLFYFFNLRYFQVSGERLLSVPQGCLGCLPGC